MPRRRLATRAVPDLDFGPVRQALEVPEAFPVDVQAAAEVAAHHAAAERDALDAGRCDATNLPLVTVDPPGSMDLDQALHVAAGPNSGYRVSYAIADVARFVAPDGPVDTEARRRGETLYCPDLRTPLHPAVLGEGAASLLPNQDRPALLWTIDLDAHGDIGSVDLRRATVRSRARLDYAGVQALIDADRAPEPLALLPTVGRLRLERARNRGAIDLGRPDQQVVAAPGGGWTLEYRRPLAVETWNAQVSLLTGIAAARSMLDAGVGLLRTLPPADEATLENLRRLAPGLDVTWPEGAPAGAVVGGLDPGNPRHAAFADVAGDLLRGAGYTAFEGSPPTQPDHAGIGCPYAHVTAPIRRLCDRFANEVCVAVAAGVEVPEWVRRALPLVPPLMATSDKRAHELERTCVDRTEAWLLSGQVGATFQAAVARVDKGHATVVLDHPAIRARCDGDLELGQRITVRLITAEVATATVRFAAA